MSPETIYKLDLRDQKYRDDPWNSFAPLRDLGPVVRIKMPLFGKSWAATTYEAVNTVLKDSESFVRDPRHAGRNNFIAIQWMLPRSLKAVIQNMLGKDGKDHRRRRSLVDKAFARHHVEGMDQRLETLTEEQLDIVAEIAERDGQVDLVEHYSRPLPLTVICELLGLPLEDRPKFRKWFEPISKVNSIFGIVSIGHGFGRINRYLRDQFDQVRREPRDGLMTQLVQAEHEGQGLSQEELLSMVFLLLVAGHETTVHLINNMLLALFANPHPKATLLADWSKCDSAIEETLRYSSPLQMTKPRYVARDMEFHGQLLKRGEMIAPLIASANYDPARFEHPHKFELDRAHNYHMSFGSGPHTCLGMKLARAETFHAVKGLFDRWPDLQPVFDVKHPDWGKRIGTRGFNTLKCRTKSSD